MSQNLRDEQGEATLPGEDAVVQAALTIGIILMGIQLWLLTVALDLYLGGRGHEVWQLAAASGAVFAGGMMMLRFIHRRPALLESQDLT